jgi:DNA-binding transcriptional regulator YhcF (GntR family)
MFHKTRIPLRKWLTAITMVADGQSVREMALALQVNKNTACRLKARIWRAYHNKEERAILRSIENSIQQLSTGEEN